MRPLNAIILRDHLASASDTDSLMVAMCDAAPRFYPLSDNGGLVRASTASNGTRPHTMAPCPASTIKKLALNYEDMPAAIRAFTRWLLSHEGRQFYMTNPTLANYIEGITKYDMLTAIDHHQHDLTRSLCSTSMFSLTICITSSEHQH